jgi:hypothetical protein
MTTTTYKGAYLPQVTGDSGTWGTLLNTNTFPVFDENLGGIAAVGLASSPVTLSASQDACAILRLTGTLTANITITTACQGFKFIENLTAGAYTVTVTSGVGTPLVLPQGSHSLIIFDATNGPRLGVDLQGVANTAVTLGSVGISLMGCTAASQIKALSEVRQSVTAAGSSLNIDMSAGWNVNLTLSATVTAVTVSNWPSSGVLGRLTLDVTSTGAYNITGWPGTTRWPYGSAPTVTSSGKDTFVLTSGDGGSTFRGFVAGQALS